MVWARTKLMIHDDMLRPRPTITIHFTGMHPDKFYHEIPRLLQTIFRVSEHAIQEKKYAWHKGEPEKFKVTWELNKDLDNWSYYWIEVDIDGSVSKGYGTAAIKIEGALRTEYPQDTIFQKSLLYEILRMFWHRTFYFPKRERYLSDGRKLMAMFISDLKMLTKVE